MERYKLLKSRPELKHAARLFVLLIMATCCISCGPQVLKGRPPFISISSMSLVESKLSAVFDIRNENGLPMTIDRIDITVRVNEVELTRKNDKYDLLIGTNSTEQVRVDELPDEFKQRLLDSLESGEVKSLPFDLKGNVHTVEDGTLYFAHKGYLYPVPGKPGHFRSAVTQAQRLQREKDF
jgi:LEA14-like dessication related protein